MSAAAVKRVKQTLVPFSPMPMLGTMTFGNQIDEKQAHQILDHFVKIGGVWIDTAEAYPVPPTLEKGGATEKIIGTWISKQPDLRSKIALATKIAGPTPAGNSVKLREATLTGQTPADHPAQDFTPEQIKRAVDASLARLQTDYIDLYQLHWPSRPVPLWGEECFTPKMAAGEYGMRPPNAPPNKDGVPVEDIVKCMAELIQSGKILAWGLSNETAYGITLICETCKRLNVPLPISVQNDFSLLDRRFESQQAEAASHYGIKLLAYGPLSGGTLTGKYFTESGEKTAWSPSWRHQLFPKFQARYHADRSAKASAQYQVLAKQNKLSPVQLALGWCATRFFMGCVIIGANTVEDIEANFRAVMDGPKNITPEIRKKINLIHEERPNPNVSYSDPVF